MWRENRFLKLPTSVKVVCSHALAGGWGQSVISVTGGYFTPAPVLISRFRGLSWMGLGLTPVGVELEVYVVIISIIEGEYTSSCIPLSYCTIL